MKIADYAAPAMVTWQLTRDCDLACLHCCTDSAPGRALPGELTRDEALRLARQIAEAEVPYVMLVGGEPTLVPHFFEVAETLSNGGVFLKIETNGQKFKRESAKRLGKLLIRSVQISIDGATQKTYAKMRPGGQLKAATAACRAARSAGMPLEITFAPSRLNLHEAEDVIALAADLGAFRFNTGALMRMGTAAKLWDRLAPDTAQYEGFYALLERKERELAGKLELCFRPFSMRDEMKSRTAEPSGTLLILPDGRVKVSAPIPTICADLKKVGLLEAWEAYRRAWESPVVHKALKDCAEDESLLAKANDWMLLEDLPALMV